MEWFSWVIAIGVGLSAVISPSITAFINNKHQLKIRNIEIYELSKRKALENYITASFNLSANKTADTEANFFIALNNLYLYFPEIDNISYDDLSSFPYVSSIDESSYLFQKVIKNLSKQIKKI